MHRAEREGHVGSVSVCAYIHTQQHTQNRLTLPRTVQAKTYLPKAPLPQHSDELEVVDTKSVGRINPDPISFFGALLALSS